MEQKRNFIRIAFFFLAALLILACATVTEATVVVPAVTVTQEVADTVTSRPTSSPKPTATKVLPTPTAAPVGVTVSNASYEVTVVKVRQLESVYLSETQYWAANPGYQFVELGVRVKNLKPDTEVSVRWDSIYIIEKEGSYYPGWGAFKAVDNGVEINPSGLVFYEITNPGDKVVFKNSAYLRLIFTVKLYDKTTILFGFDDAPLISIDV